MVDKNEKFSVDNINLDYQDIDQFVLDSKIDENKLSMAVVGAGQGGGKIAAEFCRFGIPMFAYNTCVEDLNALEETINKMKNPGKFYRLDLEGDNGSAKSIKKGREAIAKTIGPLKEKIKSIEELETASFVWICVALGGGTGAGSLTPVTTFLQALRHKKKWKLDNLTRVPVGVIAAVPERSAKSKIKMNVVNALLDLTKMHASGQLGAVVLVDNEKMINDFNESYVYDLDNIEDKNWATDGNAKVARIITELALSTSCPAQEMFDTSEMLDIWGLPGFLAIGKQEINDDAMLESYCDSNYKEIPKTFAERSKAFENILSKSFGDSIFVEGADMETAIHGGLVVVADGDIIRSGDAHILNTAMNKVLNSDGMEQPHFGFITTELSGTYKNPSDKGGRLFSLCVSKRVPQYIQDWCEDAKSSKMAYNKARLDMQDMFSMTLDEGDIDMQSVSMASNNIDSIDLLEILSLDEDLNKEREDSLDEFDSLFAEIAGDKEEENEDDIYDGLFDN